MLEQARLHETLQTRTVPTPDIHPVPRIDLSQLEPFCQSQACKKCLLESILLGQQTRVGNGRLP